uniref:Uncharacterized protein n=1 Tax=Rhizophora mucronata TaxID=61149 RepID=A0A2P2ITI2_RHIMU
MHFINWSNKSYTKLNKAAIFPRMGVLLTV